MFNTTRTTNGMSAYRSSNSPLLDLFFEIGNTRELDDNFKQLCYHAHRENPDGFLSVVLWTRDAREGAGRRNITRQILRALFTQGGLTEGKALAILDKLVDLGRWDDVWKVALGTPYEDLMAGYIRDALASNDSLCSKWLPRKGIEAAKIRTLLGMRPKQYRRTIVDLTKVVETPICNGNFQEINYNHVPSQAMMKYSRLFGCKDEYRFQEYKEGLVKGTTKVNTKTLYPYQITKNVYNDPQLAEAQWVAKSKELTALNTSFLPVIDVSGSMGCESGAGVSCMEVAVSLGLILSEVANNAFSNSFITFSENPELINLDNCRSLEGKLNRIKHSNWGFNTDLNRVFDLVLSAAKTFKIAPENMPKYLLVISDMQFDQGTEGQTATGMIQEKYKKAGYKAPVIVYWNVAKGYGNVPSISTEEGIIMISGFNTSLLDVVITSPEDITPSMFLDKVLNNPRYQV